MCHTENYSVVYIEGWISPVESGMISLLQFLSCVEQAPFVNELSSFNLFSPQ